MTEYSIGELSASTGVKVPTIRYYEQVGLLEVPPRSEGNQRRYGGDARNRLRFISHARAMGFSMQSLRDMLRLSRHRESPCADVDALVRDQLAEVDGRIARLTALRAELGGMLDSRRHGTVGECRIIEVLSDHAECHSDH